MAQAAQISDRRGRTQVSYPQAVYASALTTVVYRSRAVQSFSDLELLELTKACQARNRSEAITGLMLYDDSQFFQWLEGPEDGLSRVMHSISNDIRHTDVEVIARQHTETRTFAGWDMKLAMSDAAPAPWTGGDQAIVRDD